MIQGAVHSSPGIYLTAEENPRNPQLGSHSTSEREDEGKKKRVECHLDLYCTYRKIFICLLILLMLDRNVWRHSHICTTIPPLSKQATRDLVSEDSGFPFEI